MAMNEARLILPAAGNDGQDLGALHGELQARLCEQFGGFTATHGHGGWKAPDGTVTNERVVVYDVACDRAELRTKFVASPDRGLAVLRGRATGYLSALAVR